MVPVMKIHDLLESNPDYLNFKGSSQKRKLKKEMKREIERFKKMDHRDPKAYPEDWTADQKYKVELAKKGKKLPTSKYTDKFKKMYGESLNENLEDYRLSALRTIKNQSKVIADLASDALGNPVSHIKPIGSVTSKSKFTENSDIDIGIYLSKTADTVDEKLSHTVQSYFVRWPIGDLGVLNTLVFVDSIKEDVSVALKNKAEKTGIPVSILRKVFNRGMAAWRTGHRPGVAQVQWAMGRVNSFLVGGPARKADKDLWDAREKGA